MEMWKESQIRQLTFAKGIDTAFPILLNFAKNIGFSFCGISITSPERSSFKPLHINNYPRTWNQQYEEKSYEEIDPVISHCNRSMLPIIWKEEIFSNIPGLWEKLQDQGLKHGWSQSFHHEESGLCSILSLARPHCSISPLELYEHFGYMFYVTSHLSELFARTLPMRSSRNRQARLSPREIEVLKLCASGKTAYETARILNLSERTVNYHVQNMIVKLNVCNKISAVIAAAKAGII
ncbi:autoinducer binding domain-containing protein [Pseudomonas sp. B2M1-30]|uniref:autoinducer binding domain-containing protein n=1 Tax=Pseudomonas TaxID=286 RepID=UPI0021C702EF|nr:MULTISPECIES: autoinducer binding domain-containing protein [Pseudomonas]MCU0120333.1 autoinducer binding domain-containing protein [Pseudomonas sp. B2M1-30]MCU7260837.1 autoinducer binding domain-containing protein [Pseudomonas koreensis]